MTVRDERSLDSQDCEDPGSTRRTCGLLTVPHNLAQLFVLFKYGMYVCLLKNLKSRYFGRVKNKWQTLNGVLWFYANQSKTQSTLTGMSILSSTSPVICIATIAFSHSSTLSPTKSDNDTSNLPCVKFMTKFALRDIRVTGPTNNEIQNQKLSIHDNGYGSVYIAIYILLKLMKRKELVLVHYSCILYPTHPPRTVPAIIPASIPPHWRNHTTTQPGFLRIFLRVIAWQSPMLNSKDFMWVA